MFTCGQIAKSFSTGYTSHTTTPSHLFHTVLQRLLEHFQLMRCPLHHNGDNPADLLTRGISAQQLFSSELWLHGPPCSATAG